EAETCGTAASLPPQDCLDTASFPRFAELLAATQEYAALTGFRFSPDSFSGLSALALGAEETRAVRPGAEQTGDDGATTGSGPAESKKERLRALKLKASPVVLEIAERLQAGDPSLQEELERASRLVLSESVRSAVLATCRRLCLWPPEPWPEGIEASDCCYEDLSSTMDVIAQRAWNDEVRRKSTTQLRSGAESYPKESGGISALGRRALTASYLVDFAANCSGMALPPVPAIFPAMLAELEARAAEFEERTSPTDDAPCTPQAPQAPASPSRSVLSFARGLEALRRKTRRSPPPLRVDALGGEPPWRRRAACWEVPSVRLHRSRDSPLEPLCIRLPQVLPAPAPGRWPWPSSSRRRGLVDASTTLMPHRLRQIATSTLAPGSWCLGSCSEAATAPSWRSCAKAVSLCLTRPSGGPLRLFRPRAEIRSRPRKTA
ncbi:unnamed protein product, partial [Polarella glacialis]